MTETREYVAQNLPLVPVSMTHRVGVGVQSYTNKRSGLGHTWNTLNWQRNKGIRLKSPFRYCMFLKLVCCSWVIVNEAGAVEFLGSHLEYEGIFKQKPKVQPA